MLAQLSIILTLKIKLSEYIRSWIKQVTWLNFCIKVHATLFHFTKYLPENSENIVFLTLTSVLIDFRKFIKEVRAWLGSPWKTQLITTLKNINAFIKYIILEKTYNVCSFLWKWTNIIWIWVNIIIDMLPNMSIWN